MSLKLTPEQLTDFDTDGFLIVDELLSAEETELLNRVARADASLHQARTSRRDGEGGAVDLVVENDLPDNSIYSAIVRSESVMGTVALLLEDEVYHYHHKMVLKEPRVGGAWAWHQDYGYWYNNGCLFPDMASCMIAVDEATRDNGCLQVLRGSHRLGRIDHIQVGDQTGADPERVQIALNRLELVYCELKPGSAVFFHCNTLHRSDQNKSDNARWAFICCYNTAHNDPYKESKHPRYSPLEQWSDEKILSVGQQHLLELESVST